MEYYEILRGLREDKDLTKQNLADLLQIGLIKSVFNALWMLLYALWDAITIGIKIIGGWTTIAVIALIIIGNVLAIRVIKKSMT